MSANPPKDLSKLPVVYHHKSGDAFYVNPEDGTIIPVSRRGNDRFDPKGLKGPNGLYRSEVKNECKRLYFHSVPVREISERTGVPITTLDNWIYGIGLKDHPKRRAWKTLKTKYLEELKQQNLDAYIGVERKVLEKMDKYLSSKTLKINNTREFRDFADVIAKVLRPEDSKKASSAKTQINIMQNVTPLTQEEARKIISNDPVKVISSTVEDVERPEGDSNGGDS